MQVLADQLRRECSGLLGHRTSEIVSSLSDPSPQEGLLPTWLCRVRVDSGAAYTFTLTRQSGFDGTHPRLQPYVSPRLQPHVCPRLQLCMHMHMLHVHVPEAAAPCIQAATRATATASSDAGSCGRSSAATAAAAHSARPSRCRTSPSQANVIKQSVGGVYDITVIYDDD